MNKKGPQSIYNITRGHYLILEKIKDFLKEYKIQQDW